MQFQFQSLAELFSMGGHGPYVWACYVITAAVMGFLLASPWRKKTQLLKQLQQQYRNRSARK